LGFDFFSLEKSKVESREALGRVSAEMSLVECDQPEVETSSVILLCVDLELCVLESIGLLCFLFIRSQKWSGLWTECWLICLVEYNQPEMDFRQVVIL